MYACKDTVSATNTNRQITDTVKLLGLVFGDLVDKSHEADDLSIVWTRS